MLSRVVAIVVVTTVSAVMSPVVSVPAAQRADSIADPIDDPDVYSLLSRLIPAVWASVSGGEVVLQRETTLDSMCQGSGAPLDAEWTRARDDFRAQNARPRLLQPRFSMRVPYRLIARSDIEADDARLALKYPGIWQRRPESIEFVAVSAVGFNSAKTKAIVYVRSRSTGAMNFLERQAREWVHVPSAGCGWVA